MRRLGAILVILGSNLIVGAIGLAFYRAYFECIAAAGGCTGGPMGSFADLMTSTGGIRLFADVILPI